MLYKATALSISFATMLCLMSGCDANPNSSSGTNSPATLDDVITTDNYTDPGSNPGLSGAAPHPAPQQPAP